MLVGCSYNPALSRSANMLPINSAINTAVGQFNESRTGIGDDRNFEYLIRCCSLARQDRHFVVGFQKEHHVSPSQVSHTAACGGWCDAWLRESPSLYRLQNECAIQS